MARYFFQRVNDLLIEIVFFKITIAIPYVRFDFLDHRCSFLCIGITGRNLKRKQEDQTTGMKKEKKTFMKTLMDWEILHYKPVFVEYWIVLFKYGHIDHYSTSDNHKATFRDHSIARWSFGTSETFLENILAFIEWRNGSIRTQWAWHLSATQLGTSAAYYLVCGEMLHQPCSFTLKWSIDLHADIYEAKSVNTNKHPTQ